MNLANFLFWVVVGVSTSFIFLLTQQWSVSLINPQKAKSSLALIICGAIIRWIFVFAVLSIAISFSLKAMMIAFSTFMIIRLLFLLNWQGWLRPNRKIVDQA